MAFQDLILCFNVILVKKTPIAVANHKVESLVKITIDDATGKSSPCLMRRKSATPSLMPIPAGKKDKTPYPIDVK